MPTLATLILAGLIGNFSVSGADLKEGQQQLLTGNYSGCITLARQAMRERQNSNEEWQLLLSKALLATGQYPEAQKAMREALALNPWSLRLRWQAREVYQSVGDTNGAAQATQEIVQLVG